MEASKDAIRISKIAGRYLVFDVKDVTLLRRDHEICAILVGVTPQATNQNVFSGLPLEMAPEEAKVLVDRGLALIEDDIAAHISQLSKLKAADRKRHVDCLLQQRRALQARAAEELAERRKRSEEARRKSAGKPSKRRSAPRDVEGPLPGHGLPDEAGDTRLSGREKAAGPSATSPAPILHITPSTSASLLVSGTHHAAPSAESGRSAVVAHLNSSGFYMTPGLRFGCDFSLYPGDPFRYHAHFMARCYGWNERIDVLDLVTNGRLATRVKKGYVIAADQPGDAMSESGAGVRAFTIEWAAI